MVMNDKEYYEYWYLIYKYADKNDITDKDKKRLYELQEKFAEEYERRGGLHIANTQHIGLVPRDVQRNREFLRCHHGIKYYRPYQMDETLLENIHSDFEDLHHRHNERFQGSQEHYQTKCYEWHHRRICQQTQSCEATDVRKSRNRTAEKQNGDGAYSFSTKLTKNQNG